MLENSKKDHIIGKETIIESNVKKIYLALDNDASLIAKAKVPPSLKVTCSNPAIACCNKFKFVFVLSPQVPAFSPVAINSSFKSVENVEAICFVLYAAVSISVQVTVVPVSISDHTISIGVPTLGVNTKLVGTMLLIVSIVTLPTLPVMLTPVTE